MDDVFYISIGITAFLVILWIFFETHYFIHIVITLIRARFIKKKVGLLDETSCYGICSTTDIDVFFDHMNNTRYLREVDFARTDFYMRSGIYKKVCEKKGAVLVGANAVFYRLPIRPLTAYRITSKIVYWDKKSIYMEHHFITTSDDKVRATVISQQRIKKCDVEEIFQELQELEAPIVKPEMPVEIVRLVESIIRISKEKSKIISPTDEKFITTTKPTEDINSNGHMQCVEVVQCRHNV